MGRNAAFGRPPAHDPLREWWYAKTRTTRINILISFVVGAVALVLLTAATSDDPARSGSRVNATQPTVTVGTPTSTTSVGTLFPAAEPSTPADPGGLSSTTSSTTAVAPPVRAAPSARSVTPSATRATATAPAATVPTQDVIYTEVPTPVTTVPVSRPPVATTAPPTTATPTTPPPTTVPRAASTPTTTALLGLPPLIGTR